MFALAILWCVILIFFVGYDEDKTYYLAGFVFGLVSFLITALVHLLVTWRVNHNTTEITMIPGYASSAYVVISVIVNLIFVYQTSTLAGAVCVVINVLAIIAYFVVVFGNVQYANRVTAQADRMNYKTSQIGLIKSKLASAIGMCDTPEVRTRLVELKQKVDYSDNLSQDIVVGEESRFYEQLNMISDLISSKSDKELVLAEIEKADRTWMTRNSVLATKR
jgi:ABC-type multidrug transport system fused ATPase/permease subunit